TCTKCNVEKNLTEYNIIKARGTYCSRCKLCIKSVRKLYRENNKKLIKKQKQISYLNNKDTYKNYYIKNEKRLKKIRKKYIANNKNLIRSYDKNRDPVKRKISQKTLYQKRRKNIEFVLRNRVSSIIHKVLKQNESSKNNESCTKYLPYTFQELKGHLESQFEPWMTWENWGV